MSETAKYRVIDTSRTITDDTELITSLIQKYGFTTFKSILDKALEKVMIAEKEQIALAKQKEKETAGLNEARLNSLYLYSRLYNQQSANPEALKEWLRTRTSETLQKIDSEIKQNERGMRDIFHGNVKDAIAALEQEIIRKNNMQNAEKPKETQEEKEKKSLREKMKAFVS